MAEMTLDQETRHLLRLAISNRRREETPYLEERDAPRHHQRRNGGPVEGHPYDEPPPLARPPVAPEPTVSPFALMLAEQEAAYRALAERVARAADVYGLELREAQVLALICEGLTDREAGERLCLSRETVRKYVQRTLRKMQARNRAHAAALAVAAGAPVPGMEQRQVTA